MNSWIFSSSSWGWHVFNEILRFAQNDWFYRLSPRERGKLSLSFSEKAQFRERVFLLFFSLALWGRGVGWGELLCLRRLTPHPNLPPKGKEHNFFDWDSSLRSVWRNLRWYWNSFLSSEKENNTKRGSSNKNLFYKYKKIYLNITIFKFSKYCHFWIFKFYVVGQVCPTYLFFVFAWNFSSIVYSFGYQTNCSNCCERG